jgi:hypothetical protein
MEERGAFTHRANEKAMKMEAEFCSKTSIKFKEITSQKMETFVGPKQSENFRFQVCNLWGALYVLLVKMGGGGRMTE